jgi:hypothetical protein
VLREATHDPSGFVAVKAAIEVVLRLEHPLGSDDDCTRRAWNEPPSVVSLHGIKLSLHGHLLVGVMESCMCRCRDRGDHHCGSHHGVPQVQFVNTISGFSHHQVT